MLARPTGATIIYCAMTKKTSNQARSIRTPRQDTEGREIPRTIPLERLHHISEGMSECFSAVEVAYRADSVVEHFNPPYDSPLEERFAFDIAKHLDSEVTIVTQSWVKTRCGNYRVDFLLNRGALRLAVETDGKNFHDPIRDLWRDSLILGTGTIDAIVRFRGTDLFGFPNDCLYLLAFWYPKLFSERGHQHLFQLATRQTRKALQEQREAVPETNREAGNFLDRDDFPAMLYPCSACETQEYPEDEHRPCPDGRLVAWHRSRTLPHSAPRWKALYEFACTTKARSLEQLMENYRLATGKNPELYGLYYPD